MIDRRLCLAVAACAVVVHLGALWNRFALDDVYIVALNPLVRSWDGMWRAFGEPYWPAVWGGKMYRPLPLATYGLDWTLGLGTAWFHGVNLLWHAATSVAVAACAHRLAGRSAALAAGLVFAVHPIHVEAVANVVGRAELMAALFATLSVYAALARHSVGWSAAAFALGLLSKENAAVAPGLVAWGWMLGLGRPARPKAIAFVASWVVVGLGYAVVRSIVLVGFERFTSIAPVFLGATWLDVRLTAVAALADVVRLLVFPLTLRVEYSPAERTLVESPLDARFVVGLLCFAAWAALLIRTWRRGRTVEAFGLGWIAIALLPVANLVFPTGVLVAERTLYLSSVGVALALGAALRGLDRRRFAVVTGSLVVLGGLRSALRVPVWRDDATVALSVLEDSPRSYRGPAMTGALLLAARQPAKALAAFQVAIRIYGRGHTLQIGAADAAFAAGRPDLAREYMARADALCPGCPAGYVLEAAAARARGDSAVADSLLARARLVEERPL